MTIVQKHQRERLSTKEKKMQPIALDLFCCAGGVAEGLHRAGYQVVGVDIKPQKNYPFAFIQADVMNISFAKFALVWASPPCQGYSDMQHAPGAKEHPRLIEPVRNKLIRAKVPYVIENVMGAPLVNPIVLCGCQFGLGVDGFRLERQRQFECSFPVDQPECGDHSLPVIGVYGGHVRCRSAEFWRDGGADFPNHDKPALAKQALGIDWMTMNEMSQAIPPAFARYIGTAALIHRANQPAPAPIKPERYAVQGPVTDDDFMKDEALQSKYRISAGSPSRT